MNIENFIKEQAIQLKASRRDIDISPDIKSELMDKWTRKYGLNGSGISDYILIMSYTQTGNFVLTGDTFYFDNYLQDGLRNVKYKEIADAIAEKGGIFRTDRVVLRLVNGEKIVLDGCIDGIDVIKFAQILMHIVQAVAKTDADLVVSKQGVLSYELPYALKLLYLKIICNYAYIDDCIIDINEYNAIGRFSVRMELDTDTRSELRKYMNFIDNREKTGTLFRKAKEMMRDNSGYWDCFRYSLMQDVLYMHDIKDAQESWTEDGFIGSLMQICNLSVQQVDTMQYAVGLNMQMQQKNTDLRKLKKNWLDFVKSIKYTQGYVPSAYLFCSGSVYSIDSYRNFLEKEDASEKAINKIRECILQEIIINNQKTINVLIGDMNFLAEQLDNAVEESEAYKEKFKRLLVYLKAAEKLTKENKITT